VCLCFFCFTDCLSDPLEVVISDDKGHAAVVKPKAVDSAPTSDNPKKKKKKKTKTFEAKRKKGGVRGKIEEKLEEVQPEKKLLKQFREKRKRVEEELKTSAETTTVVTTVATTTTVPETTVPETSTTVAQTSTSIQTTTTTMAASETKVAKIVTTEPVVVKTEAKAAAANSSRVVAEPKVVEDEEEGPNVVDILTNKHDKRLKFKTKNEPGDGKSAERSLNPPVKLIEARFKPVNLVLPQETESAEEVKLREEKQKKERVINSEDGARKYLLQQQELEMERKRLEEQLKEFDARGKQKQEALAEKLRKEAIAAQEREREKSVQDEAETARQIKRIQDHRMGKLKESELEAEKNDAHIPIGQDKVQTAPPGGLPKPQKHLMYGFLFLFVLFFFFLNGKSVPAAPDDEEDDEAPPKVMRPQRVMQFTQPPRVTPKPTVQDTEAMLKKFSREHEARLRLQKEDELNQMAELKNRLAEEEKERRRLQLLAEENHQLAQKMRLGESVKLRKQDGFDPSVPF
jgi:hypothetical protein